ncbi:MAG TPA: DNA primase, partial [Acidimicrobiaceae bacterium]|nr:DNA primase [Acidimicrobiaceae bacterium]
MSGDAISFLRETEHLDFVAAVEQLADRLGIELRRTGGGEDPAERQRRKQLHALLERAAEFFHDQLLGSPHDGPARTYLRGRGYDRELVEKFQIGYAPPGRNALARVLLAGPPDADADADAAARAAAP